jgi:DNA end-binding protein Ku
VIPEAAMPRAIWKGNISFGLVNVPVMVLPAESRKRLSFKLLDKRDKAGIKYERVNDQTGKPVAWQDIVKGYEYEDGEYVVLTDKDFKAAAVEATQTIDIEDFVDREEIDQMYFDQPYYLVPGKKGEKGYVLLRETMERTGKLAIGRVVIRTREHLAAVFPRGDALVLNLMRFHHELVDPKKLDVPAGDVKAYKIKPKEVGLAEKLVDAMSSKWKPEKYKDEYYDQLMGYIEKKAKTGEVAAPKPRKEKAGKVIDLMELLQKSVKEKPKAARASKKKSKPPTVKAAQRKRA